MKILFKNIFINSPVDNVRCRKDLFISNGIIKKIGTVDRTDRNTMVIYGDNLTAVPGLFDMHVHFREPGHVYKEDINSGIQSAANGGFTGVLCMPNTLPPVDSQELLKNLKNKVKGSVVDVFFTCCATKNRKGGQISNFKKLLNNGAIAFTDDGSSVMNDELIRKILINTKKFNTIFLQHAEIEFLTKDGVMNEGNLSKKLKLKGIPCKSETIMTLRDLLIAKDIKGCNYHLQHISCGDSIDIIKAGKKDGLNVTTEVCPHHFILDESVCESLNSNTKMNPPLRSISDVKKITKALKDDIIDVICTDHAPHSLEEKSMSFEKAPFGIVGLETAVGLTYTYLCRRGIISFEKIIEKMSVNPRKILRLPDIHIKEGYKANLTVLDITQRWTINKNKFKSKSKNTPFNGYKVTCKPFAVINNNKIQFCDL